MSIDSMRFGGGRCPPLLVGALLIACIMMVCNWWTLSSTNLELLRQIDELNEQIKISVEERDQYATQKGECDKQVKECKSDAGATHVRLSQNEESLSMCNKEIKSLKQLEITKNATLDALRVDKKMAEARVQHEEQNRKNLEQELNEVKDELKKLKLTLNSPPQKQIPVMPAVPIVHVLGKQSENKTVLDTAPIPQANPQPEAGNIESPGQELQDRDIDKIRDDAAEVNDANNVMDALNLKLLSDVRDRETK